MHYCTLQKNRTARPCTFAIIRRVLQARQCRGIKKTRVFKQNLFATFHFSQGHCKHFMIKCPVTLIMEGLNVFGWAVNRALVNQCRSTRKLATMTRTLLQNRSDEKDFCRFCILVPSGGLCKSHSQGLATSEHSILYYRVIHREVNSTHGLNGVANFI